MSETETAVELVGVELPPPGTYAVDPVHSTVSFVVRHLMVSKVRGHFSKFSGTIVVADPPEGSTVTAEIDAASIDTKEPNRDAHIRTADFLDVEHHPTISFEGGHPVPKGGNEFSLPGQLTIRGVTKPITLDCEYTGVIVHPQMGTRLGLSASADINREDFGVNFNAALEAGGFVLGKTLRLEIEVEAIAQT